MVDALHQAHRALRPGGTLIDLRPDSAHQPRVQRGGRTVGRLFERRDAIVDNHFSDRAVGRVVREGLLEPIRSGHFYYSLPPMDLPTLDDWLATSRRIGGYTRGTRAALVSDPGRPIVVRRPLAYGIYRRL
jgi:hypothetical protein